MKKYLLEIEIPGLPKSPNVLMKKGVVRLKRKERQKWTRTIHLMTVGHRPGKPLELARLTLTRHSTICPDFDGLVGSFKFPVDALVDCGIIIDDNMQVIGMPDFRWEKAKANEGKITIRVESLE